MRRSHMRVTWRVQPRRVCIVEKNVHAADAERLGG